MANKVTPHILSELLEYEFSYDQAGVIAAEVYQPLYLALQDIECRLDKLENRKEVADNGI